MLANRAGEPDVPLVALVEQVPSGAVTAPLQTPNLNLSRKGERPMRRSIQVLAVTSALVAGLAAAPLLHAHESEDSGGSMMGPGMMGQGGMMGMMGQMSEMMETCNKMMRSMMQDGSDRPNEQRRNDAPEREEAPEENG